MKSERKSEETAQVLYKNLIKILEISEAEKEAQRKQDEFNTYFAISLKLAFVDKVYQVGCYHTERLARKIYRIVYEALENEPNLKKCGWFDLSINPYKGTIVKCPAGLRLEEPGCGITMVQTQLTYQELKRLGEWVPSIIEHARLLQKSQEDEEVFKLSVGSPK